MKWYALANPGLQELAGREIGELTGVAPAAHGLLLEFRQDAATVLSAAAHLQAPRRLLLAIGEGESPAQVELADVADVEDFTWKDFIPKNFAFKVEVEGVKGQENRLAIAKIIAAKLFACFSADRGYLASLHLKKNDLCFVLCAGDKYRLGLDVFGRDVSARQHRVFTHQASMKGDLAYYLVRASGFTRGKRPEQKNSPEGKGVQEPARERGERLLVGFVKDGTIMIEAALYAQGLPVHRGKLSIGIPVSGLPRSNIEAPENFKAGGAVKLGEAAKREVGEANLAGEAGKAEVKSRDFIQVYGFDESLPNVTAARKNARLAGVKDVVDLRRCSLEDLDVKYGENFFDRILFHLTSKDERKLNELFYQCRYLLKPGGMLLVVTSSGFGVPAPADFNLQREETLQRGGAAYRLWVFVKGS